ncbi:MAG: SUMF1/EgtB/PvdO family nonheme iron enzyme [Elusimicrobia bacterium]|nr:SUMF1/EgtB/PvdO family nonheme iron enzyme [Elusimicrobiota bacterium]
MAQKPFNNRVCALKRYLLPFALLCSGTVPAFAQLAAPALVYPADGAVGVSQAPGLKFYSVTGSTVQYQVQVALDSLFSSLVYDFNQVTAQTFTQGVFAGRDGTISVSSDAYQGASTATFTFYSSVTYTVPLNPDTVYWYQACVSSDSGGAYSGWSAPWSFTTGEFASQFPINSASISSVVLSSPTGSGTISVTFHIRSNNVISGVTANGGAYNTADWVFVKFSTEAGASGSWNHAVLASGGSVDAGATLTLASDKMGVFIDHTATSSLWSSTVTLIWDYLAGGALVKDSAIVKVYTIPMVKIPQGSYLYCADGCTSGLNNYNGGNAVTIGSVNDIPTGAAAGWPNGFGSSYIMRYELSQGLYADFLNNVSAEWAGVLYEGTVSYGHNMTYTAANPYGSRYAAVDPNAAKNFLSAWDLWRFLSWSALRPMTEMEYQKAARDLNPDARKYLWGDEEPLSNGTTYFYSPPNEGGTHAKNYLNFGNIVGGDKVLDIGRYMSGDIYRTAAQTGASPYGAADLSGNTWEVALNCSYSTAPANGNGAVDYPAGWPTPGSAYISIRGGSWFQDSYWAGVSRRPTNDTWPISSRYADVGGRGVRGP